MSWADPVRPARSGVLGEEKADTTWDAEKGVEQRLAMILMTYLLRMYHRTPQQVEFWKG